MSGTSARDSRGRRAWSSQIKKIKSAAVFIGPHGTQAPGLVSWSPAPALLNQFGQAEVPGHPVLLARLGKKTPKLSLLSWKG